MTDPIMLNHIIEIKESCAKTEQHLSDLNGTVARHEREIQDNEECITKIKLDQKGLMIKVAGITGGLVFVATVAVNLALQFI